MTRRSSKMVYGIILLWTVCPMIPVVICGVIAAGCGCHVDEGSVHPCIVFGRDIGHLLYTMGVMGWFGLITFPTGIGALILFSIFDWWSNRDTGPPPSIARGNPSSTRQNLVLWLGLASLLTVGLTSIPALILAVKARPLATRAKIGATVSAIVLIAATISTAVGLLWRP